MEAQNGGLEDDVPFQLGDFLGSMLIFRDVRMDMNWKKNKKRKFLPVCQ